MTGVDVLAILAVMPVVALGVWGISSIYRGWDASDSIERMLYRDMVKGLLGVGLGVTGLAVLMRRLTTMEAVRTWS